LAGKEDQIKTALVVEGEKEYKEACKGINSSLREIGSEMKLVSAQFEGNAKSTEALTSKQEVLKKQLAEQSEKVKAAEEALRKMKEGGLDETNPAVQKMQTNLNNAKAEMAKTESQIKSIDGELKSSKINWESVGEVVGKVGKAFGTALAALGTAAVGAATALAGFTVSASNYADDILTISTNTHIATDDLQKYSYALNFIDGDLNTLTATMKKNTQIMSKARDGNATYSAAYDKLGISVADANGTLRDGQTVYWEVIDALGKVENETERDALAMTLLGKSGTELNTIIDAGSEAFKALGDEAEAMGVVMSEEALASLGQFNDKLQILKAGLEGLKNSAGLIALPFLDVLAGDGITILQDFSKGIQEANGDLSKMGDVIGETLGSALNLVLEQLPTFVNMGTQMISSLVSGITGNAPMIAQAAVQIVGTLVNGIAELLPVIINGAVQIVVGLAQGLGQSLPQLIPQVVAMITTIVQTLLDNIPLLVEAALQLVVGLTQGLIAAIPVLIGAVPAIITSLVGALLAAIPQIIQAGIDLLTALIGALPEIIAAIVEAIPQIIDGIITAVLGSIPQIVQAGIDLLVALIQALPQIITTIVAAMPQIIGAILTAITGAIPQIIQAGVQLFVALIQNLPTIIAEIVKAVPQIVNGIVQAFAGLVGQMVTAGGDLLRGLWQGISGAAGWLWQQVSGWASNLVASIKGFFGIHSPSTVFAEIGNNMGQGVGVGFGESMGGVTAEMTAAMGGAGNMTAAEALRSVNDGIISNVAALDSAVTAIVQQIVTGMTAQAGQFTQVGVDMSARISEGIINGLSTITDKMAQVVQSVITAFTAQHGKLTAEGVNMNKAIASGMVNGIPQITGKAAQIVQSVITAFTAQHGRLTTEGVNMDKAIASGMVQGIPQITGKAAQIVQSVITAFTAEHSKLTTEGVNMDKAIASGMVQGIPEITGKMSQIVQAIVSTLNSFTSEFTAAGQNMVRGIWQGFQSMSGWLESNVRAMMRRIVAAVRAEMQIASPSKVFAGIGAYMAEGLGQGFVREMRDVEKTIRTATASSVPEVKRPSGRISRGEDGARVQVVQNIYAGETSYAKQQREAAKQFRMIAREVIV